MEKYIEDLVSRTVEKMGYVLQRNSGKLPYIAEDGIYDDMKEYRINWWTNGFWGGLMWKLFLLSGDERFKKEAVLSEEILDGAFKKYDKLHHDVGFMWLLTSGAHLKVEENEKSYLRTCLLYTSFPRRKPVILRQRLIFAPEVLTQRVQL